MKARFVSRSSAYSVGIQSLVKESYATGDSKVLKRRIDADFRTHLVNDGDLAVALASLQFPGLPFDSDTNSLVSPRFRLGVWDSEFSRNEEGFTDDEIDMTIEKLRALGGNGGDYVEVPAVEATAPWPGYDEISDLDLIIKLVDATKISREAVIAYEQENLNREDLLALLLEEEPADAVVIEA